MTLTTVNAGMLDTQAQYNGFKNRIINGAMVIAQRGTTPTSTNLWYPADRFRLAVSNSSKVNLSQSTTAPTGFVNSILATSLAATTVGAAETYEVSQQIEGFNIADLAWGTASAATVTLSFWVRSSLTGTFGGTLQNSGNTRSYPFSYTINAANTFEQKTITVAGDTSGTWLTDNSRGIIIRWSLGVGSTYLNTANAWVAGDYQSVTGETKLVATNGATWYLTGVQLEKGSTATAFDYRPFGTELQLAQRYFYKASSTGGNVPFGFGYNTATTETAIGVPFPIVMRSIPTFTSSAANTFLLQDTANRVPTAVTMQCASVSFASIPFTTSGVTTGNGAKVLDNNTSANLSFSAEL